MAGSQRSLAERLLASGVVAADDLRAAPTWQLGRYEVLHALGAGAQGEVLLAHDPVLGRRVAIKLLRARVDEARFRLEMQALARMRHPHVVAVHDAGVHAGRPFLVMDAVGPRTLESAALERRAFVRALAQVARGCHAAHAQGVVHRDLKPTNVLLDERGDAVVVDFGVARLLDGGPAKLTHVGAAVGTPAYMAPEQVGGGPIDARTDVFALGVMLHEGLTGELPGRAEALRGVEPPLAAVVRAALSPEPARRPASAAAFADALEAWLDGRSRSSVAFVVAAVLALALVLVLVLALALAAGGDDPPPARTEPTPPSATEPRTTPVTEPRTTPVTEPRATPVTEPGPTPATEPGPTPPATEPPPPPSTEPPVPLAELLRRVVASLDAAEGKPPRESAARWVEALELAAEAARTHPRTPEVERVAALCCRLVAHAELADLLDDAGRARAARSAGALGAGLDPTDPAVDRAQARADAALLAGVLARDDLRQAEALVAEASQLDPDRAWPWLSAALLHLHRARRALPARDEASLGGARAAIEKAAALGSREPELMLLRPALAAIEAAGR